MSSEPRYDSLKFTVEVRCGDIFINGEFVDQLQWTSDAIGNTITWWLDGRPKEEEET